MKERFERLYPAGKEHIYDNREFNDREEESAIKKPGDFERLIDGSDFLGFKERYEEEGDMIDVVSVQPGTYAMSFGFQQARLNEKHHLYRNNPHEKRAIPLRLERNAPEFVRLRQEFGGLTSGAQTAGDVLYALRDLIDRRIKSKNDPEDISSSTDIIRNGASVCGGKSLISAMLVGDVFPQFDIRYVEGAVERKEHLEVRTHSEGHVWLRLELAQERAVFLYDPANHFLESYDLDSPDSVEPDDPFRVFEVYSHPSQLIAVDGASKGLHARGMKIIEVPDEIAKATILIPAVPTAHSLRAQIIGKTMDAFETDRPVSLQFRNQGVVLSTDVLHAGSAARMQYPLRNIIRL